MTPTSSTVRGVARTVSFPLLANQILVCNLSNLDEPIPRLFSFENSTPARRFAFAPPRCALAARIRLSSGPRCRGRTRRCLTSEERFRARQETGSAVPPGRPRARMTVPMSQAIDLLHAVYVHSGITALLNGLEPDDESRRRQLTVLLRSLVTVD